MAGRRKAAAAAELVRQGFVNERGRPFAAQSVASILRS
jgi:hypothetical protein